MDGKLSFLNTPWLGHYEKKKFDIFSELVLVNLIRHINMCI